jgi:hypothetical protein
MHRPIHPENMTGTTVPGVRFASHAGWSNLATMCKNLYAVTKGQQAIRDLA